MRALWTAAWGFLFGVICLGLDTGCGEPPADGPDATVPPPGAKAAEPAIPAASLVCSAEEPGGDVAENLPVAESQPREPSTAGCPDDMVHVDTTFCPDIERTCLDMEHEAINNLDICHSFAKTQRCRIKPRRIDFCIDQYEYPNRPGAHPAWMLDWYQAQATCESKGKRLCYASEWTAACEGPDHTPFPYGWERDHNKCNIDNFFIEPKKWGPNGGFLFYSRDRDIALRELARLDQSVPSGAIDACQSGFGVHDMTGNIDEWVVSDVAPREVSKWSGLKGGAWGHVRSQCRPMTYSHDPSFAYYFVGFRCCQDAEGAPRWTPSAQATPAPDVAPHDYAPDPVVVTAAAGPSKTKFARAGHAQ
jgi:hypothetical protein